MDDHTDFIRIRGLESADTEVFQGLGAASLTVSGGGGSTEFSWDPLFENFGGAQEYFTGDFVGILGQLQAALPEDGSRALPPAIIGGAVAPWIMQALVAIAAVTGPIVPIVGGISAINTLVREGLELCIEMIDVNSPRNQIKQLMALVGDIRDQLSSLASELPNTTTAVTTVKTELTNTTEAVTNLEQPLKDVALVDATIQIGDDLKARIKGKALEF